MSRGSRVALGAGTRAQRRRLAALAMCVLVGCGRVGFELAPLGGLGANEPRDNSPVDDDAGDDLVAPVDASDVDGSNPFEDDASLLVEAGTADVDGSVDASALDASDALDGADDSAIDASADGAVDASSDGAVDATIDAASDATLPDGEAGAPACIPSAATDSTCNNIDDDCDGTVDEEFAITTTSCGVGVCAGSGSRTCVAGVLNDSCVVGTATSTTDDALAPGNGLDDDCDGDIDEDLPACNTAPQTRAAGTHTITIPGRCRSVSVQLWGGAGASGESVGFAGNGPGGRGGAGGYARSTLTLSSSALVVQVGNGGAGGCDAAGTNAGSANFNGGSGGTGTGANGSDGVVAGGGAAGDPSTGNAGGRGYFGGGGGGEGNNTIGASGAGGGGGAATVLLVGGVRTMVAGGGGGGGGGQSLTFTGAFSAAGGAGGSGCQGNGQVESDQGGGGGGGGMCQGDVRTLGSGATPASSNTATQLASGNATGGSGSCGAGGAGYAIFTFAP